MSELLLTRMNVAGSVERVGANRSRKVSGTPEGAIFTAPLIDHWAREGRVFFASDGDENDLVTGQTSFADTTPTFSLQVAAGAPVAVVPLYYQLAQTGSVAGAAIDIITEIDNIAKRASGGTSETVLSSRTDSLGVAHDTNVILYSNPTGTAGYGVRVAGITLGPDVSSAEGARNEYLWTPLAPIYLMPTAAIGASLNVYTYAGTTGPTWFWTFCWAEIPLTDLTQ
jgi:hypothetical protein